MNNGPLGCVGHMGYMGLYMEEVGGGRECGKDRVKRELGVLEEAK